MRGPGTGEPVREREAWTSPFDTAPYDRNPELTPDETTALKEYACPRSLGRFRKLVKLQESVPRLLKPIEDVLSYTRLWNGVRGYLAAFLLREMSRRGRSFWSWTRDDWTETIGRRGPHRLHIIAMAYMLCGFNDLRQARGRYAALAPKVFGRDPVNLALERVCSSLAGLGYADKGATE